MHPLPHLYRASATGTADTNILLESPGVIGIESAGPVEFGGPGDLWSPEALLIAAIADCFALSFRAIARAARFEWSDLRCEVEGTLDKVDGTTRFTDFSVRATLTVPTGTDSAKAEKLMHKADRSCLITNSMIATSRLEAEVVVKE